MRALLRCRAARAHAAPRLRGLSARAASGALAPAAPPAAAAPPLTPEMISPLLDRMDGLTTIVGYDRWGFNVSNVHMRGSVLVLPTFTLLWDVRAAVDICPRSIAPMFMFTPKPEFVLIGAGLGEERHVNPALYAFLSRKGISLEVMSIVRARGGSKQPPPRARPQPTCARSSTSRHPLSTPTYFAAPRLLRRPPQPRAISTYNLLMGEGRRVAAALVALEPMSRSDASLYTDEALEALVRPRDVRAAAALAADVLPEDRLLLEGGEGAGAGASAGARAAARRTAAAAAAPAPTEWQHQAPLPAATPLQQQQQGKVGYGVPGAVRGAPSLLPPREDGSSGSTVRPGSESEIIGQQADRGKRRSGGWGGGDK